MRTVAIVQARMGSTRLPGKVAMPLAGVTALERCLRRLRQAVLLDDVVVATSDRSRDDEVVRIAARAGVASFRGSEDNVLRRYADAAQEYRADVIVRVTADCPLIDPGIVDTVINTMRASGSDYASNVLVRHLPRGLDVEAVTARAIYFADALASDPADREHVTRYVVRRPGAFLNRSVQLEVPRAGLGNDRWTLDTPEDYAFLSRVFQHLADRGGREDRARFREVLDIVDAHPELRGLNAHVEQKVA